MPDPQPQAYQTQYAPILGQQQDSITRRRWESEELIDALWLLLAGKERYNDHGEVKLRDSPAATPLMNQQGAGRVIQVIRAFVNPVVSLTRLGDEDARLLFYSSYSGTMDAIVLNQVEWGVKDLADLEIIRASLQPILFAQSMRSVDGWEGRNSKSEISETEIKNTNNNAGGFKLPSFGGGK